MKPTVYQRNPKHLCVVPITVWDARGVVLPDTMDYQPARQMVAAGKALVVDGSSIKMRVPERKGKHE